MDWIGILTLVLSGGGVSYLIIEKLFSRRQDKADAHGKEVENSLQIAELYKEVDSIVMSKTKPLETKLDKALDELNDIRTHWCCYRAECKERILYKDGEL